MNDPIPMAGALPSLPRAPGAPPPRAFGIFSRKARYANYLLSFLPVFVGAVCRGFTSATFFVLGGAGFTASMALLLWQDAKTRWLHVGPDGAWIDEHAELVALDAIHVMDDGDVWVGDLRYTLETTDEAMLLAEAVAIASAQRHDAIATLAREVPVTSRAALEAVLMQPTWARGAADMTPEALGREVLLAFVEAPCVRSRIRMRAAEVLVASYADAVVLSRLRRLVAVTSDPLLSDGLSSLPVTSSAA